MSAFWLGVNFWTFHVLIGLVFEFSWSKWIPTNILSGESSILLPESMFPVDRTVFLAKKSQASAVKINSLSTSRRQFVICFRHLMAFLRDGIKTHFSTISDWFVMSRLGFYSSVFFLSFSAYQQRTKLQEKKSLNINTNQCSLVYLNFAWKYTKQIENQEASISF